MSKGRKSHLLLGLGGVAIALLLGAVFTLGSLTLPFEPRDSGGVPVGPILYALSTFIVAALLVFGLILTRSILRLWAERRAHQPGSRFKTKMVLGALAVSFLPVVFLFFVSYALLNRTLVLWFPRPLEMATQDSRDLIDEIVRSDYERMAQIAKDVAGAAVPATARDTIHSFDLAFARGADLAWETTAEGHPVAVAANSNFKFDANPAATAALPIAELPVYFRSMPSGAELWQYRGKYFLAGRAKSGSNFLLIGRNVPGDFPSRIKEIEMQTLSYGRQRQQLRTYKSQMLLTLLLFTILLMFSATWFALFLSKQVTVPIQALAEATQEIIAGNFETRVNVQAQDELGTLVRSFNRMTEQLGDSRRQIDVFTHNLQQAVQELELTLAGRLLHAAVTVSSLGPRRTNRGYVVVVDDLTDLLRAQKAAAWQEVAQRIAHEIKNPLTPIQLSAQRLSRYLDRSRSNPARSATPDPPELVRLVGECSSLIEREVTTLESLVSEFSQFARFPTARLSSAFPNEIVGEALAVFDGRLEGIRVRKDLAPNLPAIRADGELLRRVVVNLIDNAAESMEGSSIKELLLRTRFNADRETVEIIVADSGHGISPEDKDRLFLPHFSTKDRGTGLGLAIASRIMAEHHGTIRVEDNFPVGARFILQLPMTEVASAPISPRIA